MCLGIPAKIIKIEGEFADAQIDGATIRIGLQMTDNVVPGDFVLVHAGYALEKISEKDAFDTIESIKNLMFPISDFQ
jgi:hydrogenase expression/formation protein HypC